MSTCQWIGPVSDVEGNRGYRVAMEPVDAVYPVAPPRPHSLAKERPAVNAARRRKFLSQAALPTKSMFRSIADSQQSRSSAKAVIPPLKLPKYDSEYEVAAQTGVDVQIIPKKRRTDEQIDLRRGVRSYETKASGMQEHETERRARIAAATNGVVLPNKAAEKEDLARAKTHRARLEGNAARLWDPLGYEPLPNHDAMCRLPRLTPTKEELAPPTWAGLPPTEPDEETERSFRWGEYVDIVSFTKEQRDDAQAYKEKYRKLSKDAKAKAQARREQSPQKANEESLKMQRKFQPKTERCFGSYVTSYEPEDPAKEVLPKLEARIPKWMMPESSQKGEESAEPKSKHQLLEELQQHEEQQCERHYPGMIPNWLTATGLSTSVLYQPSAAVSQSTCSNRAASIFTELEEQAAPGITRVHFDKPGGAIPPKRELPRARRLSQVDMDQNGSPAKTSATAELQHLTF